MGEALRLIQAEALPLFTRFRTAADFARHATELHSHPKDPTFIEVVAYSHVACGRLREREGRGGPRVGTEASRGRLAPYEQELVRRNEQFLLKLRDRPEEAVADLHGWRRETLRAIGFKDALSILE
jgi:hypothetical protein